MTAAQTLQDEYSSMLVAHISKADEAALNRAYKFGRKILSEGFGVLDLVSLHNAALYRIVADFPQYDLQRKLERAAEFIAECLSAFEMSLRGYLETNSRLAALNQTLQELYELAGGLNRCRTKIEVARFSIDRVVQIPGVRSGWIDLYTADGIKIVPPHDASPVETEAHLPGCDRNEIAWPPLCPTEDFMAVPSYGPGCARIPLMFDATPVGVLNLLGGDPGGVFFAEGRQTLVNIGNQISNALRRADIYESLERKVEERTRELVKVAKVKDDFLAMVSHELRTPLTSINAVIALLAAEKIGPVSTAMHKPIMLAHSNCRRLMKLVDDLLDLTSGETLNLDLKSLKLHEVLAEIFESNRISNRSHDFRLNVVGLAEKVSVVADSIRLQQVVDNLLANAVKFSGVNSQIDLTAERYGDFVRVSVADRGIGIPEDMHDYVFKRFAQVDSTSTRGAGGVSLGLTIAKAIVEAHRGTLEFFSTEGKGTTFYFDLPVEAEFASHS
jgi:signal transduction histidine kinase